MPSNNGNTRNNRVEATSAKRPYIAPRVQRYGRVNELTLSVGGSGGDTSKNPSQMRFA